MNEEEKGNLRKKRPAGEHYNQEEQQKHHCQEAYPQFSQPSSETGLFYLHNIPQLHSKPEPKQQ